MMKNQLTPANQNPSPEGQGNRQVIILPSEDEIQDAPAFPWKRIKLPHEFVQQLGDAIFIPEESWPPGRVVEVYVEYETIPRKIIAVVKDDN